MACALLIPIYEPTDKVVPFLKTFQQGEFDAFLVIDDGSGPDYQSIFQEISDSTVFEVVSYPENHGKGYALKTGISYLMQIVPELTEIVTADGDGQHAKVDILRVKEETLAHPSTLVLGTRVFENAPPKSQSGNIWVRRYFKAATGVSLPDVQTGLRGIPANLFELALSTYGDRFDYEMTFLKDAVLLAPVDALPIQTIYEDGNKGTHFRAVVDSFRIMKAPLLSLLGGLIATCLVLGFLAFILGNLRISGIRALDVPIAFLISNALISPFLYLYRYYYVYRRRHSSLRSVGVFVLGNLATVLVVSLLYLFFDFFLTGNQKYWPAAILGIVIVGIFRFIYGFRLCYRYR